MKTIKINKEAFKILTNYKIELQKKTYSETIKRLDQLLDYWYKETINLRERRKQ